MAEPFFREFNESLRDVFKFRPIPHWDPVPIWIFDHLEREQLLEVARINLQVQRQVMQAQLDAMAQYEKVLGRG